MNKKMMEQVDRMCFVCGLVWALTKPFAQQYLYINLFPSKIFKKKKPSFNEIKYKEFLDGGKINT